MHRTRGPRSDSTKFVKGDKGIFIFTKKLSLVCTLYKDSNTGAFEKKSAKIHVYAEGTSKYVGRVEFDLANYASFQGTQDATFGLVKCSDKKAKLEVGLIFVFAALMADFNCDGQLVSQCFRCVSHVAGSKN
jgi:hypothetical protein